MQWGTGLRLCLWQANVPTKPLARFQLPLGAIHITTLGANLHASYPPPPPAEGGIRTNAFVSGGYLPEAVRGTKKTGLISVADWYATFAALADVSAVDETAAQWGLPAVDGINQWPYLSSARARAPRTELALGGLSSYESLGGNTTNTFVGGMLRSDGWKLLIRNQSQPIWTGPSFPNFTTYEPNCDVGFSCLRDESTERYANCVGCSGWIANQKAQQACGFPGGPDPLLQGCLYNV